MIMDKITFWTSRMWKTFLLKIHQEVLVLSIFHGVIGPVAFSKIVAWALISDDKFDLRFHRKIVLYKFADFA